MCPQSTEVSCENEERSGVAPKRNGASLLPPARAGFYDTTVHLKLAQARVRACEGKIGLTAEMLPSSTDS